METWMFNPNEPIPTAWRACIERWLPERCDIYADPRYCSTWLEWEDATAVALWEQIEGIEFLYTFMLKPLPMVVDRHWRYDAQSFYGYGGIMTSEPASRAVFDQFNDAVDQWMCEQGVVAEFVRQHPLMHPEPTLARRAQYRIVRTNVYAQPVAVLQSLDSATRRNIAKATRAGISIERWNARNGAELFADLYQRTAKRLSMDAFYHFPRSYFDAVAELLGDHAWYLVARIDDQPIAALLVLQWGDTLTYHLGASDQRFWAQRPNDALFAALLRTAVDNAFSTVSLGGGTSTDPADSLYRYKSKFGNRHVPVFIGTRVHEPNTYQRLCTEWESRHRERASQYRSYFLRYRIGEFDRRRIVLT
ncbi:MAG: GNAT family N-acetyltransferase [Chlorobi bacterium]|nr:GNAT family N-acetyltransferase [Chlorobiota bacterium]